jgi:hypothetical protein
VRVWGSQAGVGRVEQREKFARAKLHLGSDPFGIGIFMDSPRARIRTQWVAEKSGHEPSAISALSLIADG